MSEISEVSEVYIGRNMDFRDFYLTTTARSKLRTPRTNFLSKISEGGVRSLDQTIILLPGVVVRIAI